MTADGIFLFLNALGEHGCLPRVAYVSPGDSTTRDGFKNLLIGNNIEVDAVDLSAAAAFDFRDEDTIILGPDTSSSGSVPVWLGSQAAKDNLLQSRRPILGVFEGGASFFDLIGLNIGRLHTWTISGYQATAFDPTRAYYTQPIPVLEPQSPLLTLYTVDLRQERSDLPAPVSLNVMPIARGTSTLDQDHYPIASQSAGSVCYALWGYAGSPGALAPAGKALFTNLAVAPPCRYPLYLPAVRK